MGKFKKQTVCESQRVDHPKWQKRKIKKVESRIHFKKRGVF